jgi:hypothetical protein
MAERTQWFHGTAARQLVLIEEVKGSGSSLRLGVHPRSGQGGQQRIRLMQKDMYAELTRRRRRAQIAARRWVDSEKAQGL